MLPFNAGISVQCLNNELYKWRTQKGSLLYTGKWEKADMKISTSIIVEQNRENQLDFLNIARGIGILLVVLGHSLSAFPDESEGIAEVFRTIIYLIHMPLFFVIAGFLFEKNKAKYRKMGIKKYVTSKFVVFMIPYITFSILIAAIAAISIRIESLNFIANKLNFSEGSCIEIVKSIILYINPIDDHLWFSYVMFIVLVLSFFLLKFDERVLSFVFYGMYILTFYINFPEIIWKIFRYILIFHAGRMIYKRKNWLDQMQALFAMLVFAIATVCYLVLKNDSIGLMGVFKPIAEISSSLLITKLSMYLESTKMNDILNYIGKKSYAIYLMHQPYIVPAVMLLLSGNILKNIMATIVAVAVGVIVPIVIENKLVSKSKILTTAVLGGHR